MAYTSILLKAGQVSFLVTFLSLHESGTIQPNDVMNISQCALAYLTF